MKTPNKTAIQVLNYFKEHEYGCYHMIAYEQKIDINTVANTLNKYKKDGYLGVTQKDKCKHSDMKHSFYYLKKKPKRKYTKRTTNGYKQETKYLKLELERLQNENNWLRMKLKSLI